MSLASSSNQSQCRNAGRLCIEYLLCASVAYTACSCPGKLVCFNCMAVGQPDDHSAREVFHVAQSKVMLTGKVTRRRLLRTAAMSGAALSLHTRWLVGAEEEPKPGDPGDFIRGVMQRNHLAGVSVCVVDQSKVLWSEAYGHSNIAANRSMTTDTIQNIGSVSKTFTATAVLQLWEAGRLDLDSDVSQHFPFPVRHPMHHNVPITARHLLTHTASIKDSQAYELSYRCGDPQVPLGDWLASYFTPGALHYKEKANFLSEAPGTRHEYCNVAFGLLGYLVETISKQPFADYCHEHIFRRLDMPNTGWHLSKVDVSSHAVPYTYVENGQQRGDRVRSTPAPKDEPETGLLPNCLYSFPNYPDGLVRTSISQFAHFLSAYLSPGQFRGTRILRAETVQAALSKQTKVSPGDPEEHEQGLAWVSFAAGEGRRVWGHSGGDPGISTLAVMDPERNLGVAVFANTAMPGVSEITRRLFAEFS